MRPGRQVLVRAPYYRAAQLNLLSGLTLLSLSQATADGLSISRRWKRAPETINGFKYLINNRRTRCPRRCKKCVSSVRRARLNLVATQARSAPRQ